ncbi:hypothetical protein BDV59DRAFT_2381 [Aspergillus ambiguus]|uniref:uncharacterized protein n=1 Tax=Aspergillus ambiguus TaxID=176160 RepID=UPI003CCD2574
MNFFPQFNFLIFFFILRLQHSIPSSSSPPSAFLLPTHSHPPHTANSLPGGFFSLHASSSPGALPELPFLEEGVQVSWLASTNPFLLLPHLYFHPLLLYNPTFSHHVLFYIMTIFVLHWTLSSVALWVDRVSRD